MSRDAAAEPLPAEPLPVEPLARDTTFLVARSQFGIQMKQEDDEPSSNANNSSNNANNSSSSNNANNSSSNNVNSSGNNVNNNDVSNANSNNDVSNNTSKRRGGKRQPEQKNRMRADPSNQPARKGRNEKTPGSGSSPSDSSDQRKRRKERQESLAAMKDMLQRIKQLEHIVSTQTVEIRKLKQDCEDLGAAATTFAQVVDLLRQAGLAAENSTIELPKESPAADDASLAEEKKRRTEYESFDDAELFGDAPSSVMDAADAAGASILAAMLGGKLRMLVDVRDAELSSDRTPDILVQFIELAILPVAAGLEGLANSDSRHRVKLVFPTVSRLLQYRKTMSLSSPDVIALSVLGFGSVEEQDNLVVMIAPSPDDEEGLEQMWELLRPSNPEHRLRQPVVVLNHHMLPLAGAMDEFEAVYHLRLLSVQYMTGNASPEEVERAVEAAGVNTNTNTSTSTLLFEDRDVEEDERGAEELTGAANTTRVESGQQNEDALEAAMEHAHETSVHQGFTRAMVIRAYPRPWHIFVDTSPDADADFEVAATFDEEPSTEEVNYAIVECLEGSEREDELVAQQMQEALESGQLNKVSQMLEISMGGVKGEDDEEDDSEDDDEEDSNFFSGQEST